MESVTVRKPLTKGGVLIGIGMGIGMRKYDFDDLDAAYIAFPGTMLIQAGDFHFDIRQSRTKPNRYSGNAGDISKSQMLGLKMLVIPLVVFSIIAGVSKLERNVTGKIGGYAVAYYAVTTFSAVILGIILCAGIKERARSAHFGHDRPL